MNLSIPNGYGWCLMNAALMALQVVLVGARIGGVRRQLFSKEFFEQNFPGIKPHPKGGYPDTGNGRWSSKLSDDDWIKFNNYQRAHLNYVEGIASIIVVQLIAGLFYPKVSTYLGWAYLVGRELYSWGYRKHGAQRRLIGSFFNIAFLALLALSIYGSFNSAGGVEGFKKLFQCEENKV